MTTGAVYSKACGLAALFLYGCGGTDTSSDDGPPELGRYDLTASWSNQTATGYVTITAASATEGYIDYTFTLTEASGPKTGGNRSVYWDHLEHWALVSPTVQRGVTSFILHPHMQRDGNRWACWGTEGANTPMQCSWKYRGN